MKILIVNTVPTQRDGMTNVILNLLENISDPDVHFGYVSINKPEKEFMERFRELNCKQYIAPRSLRGIFKYIKSLSVIAKDYDAIHVHGNSATLAIDLYAAFIAGVKNRIAHSHNTSCKMVIADKVLRPVFYRLCNGRLACGIDAGKWLFGNRRFEVVRNGINTSKFRFDPQKRHEIRKMLGWEDKTVIGHIGNFVEAKNHKFIFDIIKSAISKKHEVRLICVGGGNLLVDSREYIRNIGIENYVHLTGSISNPEDYMSAMDVILMPSLHEGLPLTLVEEQANGLKCIVSDAITTEADLTGNLYFQSLDSSADDWADKLIEMVSGSEKDRKAESNRCITLIKGNGYDISTESRKLYEFYKSL